MEEESREMHSEDDKSHPDKNKKRIVKTRAQVEALEKFYNEDKYPSEAKKLQLAESIGLTEKQVSGWFCHRRLKDKRLSNGEIYAIGKQDRSSGVIQDRGSGLIQDSCGSTKQGGGDRNIDTREVESGRFIENASSGSSSSLRNVGETDFEAANPRHLVPKFPVEAKGVNVNVNVNVNVRTGPSGYLKVKGRAENGAITAVKRQLGRHYREDGPPLGVEFDPLPPGAFESLQDPVDDETCYAGEPILPASPDVSRIPKLGKGCEYNSISSPYNLSMGRTKANQGSDIPEDHTRQRYYSQRSSIPSNGDYYPRKNYSAELPENPFRSPPVSGLEYTRNGSALSDYGGKIEDPRSRQIIKDGNFYGERRIVNENYNPSRFEIPVKNEMPAPKRFRGEYPHHQNLSRSLMVENQTRASQVIRSTPEMRSCYSDDDGSAETNSSMD